MTDTLKALKHVHHSAYRCRDAEQTRWFYEEVMGIPLAAALVAERDFGIPDDDGARNYMHLFFQLPDGNFIAFFDQPDVSTEEHFTRADSFDRHIAIEAESYDDMIAWQKSIQAKGKTCLGPVDHGFCDSVYMYDPNGLQVEICAKRDNYDEILGEESQKVEELMAEWSSKTRAQKEATFGKAVLDKRGVAA